MTGSSKGLGNALAHAFLEAGDAVVVNSRDAARCEAAAARLAQRFPSSTVRCFAADVGIAEQVTRRDCKAGNSKIRFIRRLVTVYDVNGKRTPRIQCGDVCLRA